jgi:integrase/recombinase XerD
MRDLFEQFVREKQYLHNVSPRTVDYYRWCFDIWMKRIGEMPTKTNLKEFVIQLTQSGISIATVNSYIRAVNSFCSWLKENDHLTEKLRIKPLKEPQKRLTIFTEEQLRRLLTYKYKTMAQHRFYALVCLAIDTGARIDELLSLKRDCVDFQNLLIKVHGKGDKERIIPISVECRKVLAGFLKTHSFELVFPTHQGTKVSYRNVLDQLKLVCKSLGITGVRASWHTLRHGFAVNHIRQGGDVFSLQRMLGHTSLEVTKRYVDLTEDDLKLVHKKTSILSRLK